MEREAIISLLKSHPDNCIRVFHHGSPCSTGRLGGKHLLRHYGGLIPDEIVMKSVMFMKVQDLLEVTDR